MKQSRTSLVSLIKATLEKKTEVNEIDFKEHLSLDQDRLKEHINAFGNSDGGGTFVFGINSKFAIAHCDQNAEEISKNFRPWPMIPKFQVSALRHFFLNGTKCNFSVYISCLAFSLRFLSKIEVPSVVVVVSGGVVHTP